MFRRGKNKSTKAKTDDMVALTGPNILSSSSVELITKAGGGGGQSGKSGGRFIGRRKKKFDVGGKGTSSAISAPNNPSNAPSKTPNNITNISLTRNPQMQPQHRASESAPQAVKKRPPLKRISVAATKAQAINERKINNRSHPRHRCQSQVKVVNKRQHQHQQHQSQEQRKMNALDIMDEEKNNSNIQRHSSATDAFLSPSQASRVSVNTNAMTSGTASPSCNEVIASQNALLAKVLVLQSKPPFIENNGGSVASYVPIRTNSAAPTSRNTAPPKISSGWSVASNTSSAMDSEYYIQSLDNLPQSQSENAFPMLTAQPNHSIRSALSDDRIRAALSRKFGRKYPPQTFHQKWFVKVDHPNWDMAEGRHKYTIKITMNPSNNIDSKYDDIRSSVADPYSHSHLSFAPASASRSLQDFVWLEQALCSEFNGALIVPMLSLALYFGTTSSNDISMKEKCSLASQSFETDASSKAEIYTHLGADIGDDAVPQSLKFLDEKIERNETVDETELANWLSDIINGVRGYGEVLLGNGAVVLGSEAMETFLYRHSEMGGSFRSSFLATTNQRASGLGSPFNNLFSVQGRCGNKSLFENFMESPFECFGIETVCGRSAKKIEPQDADKCHAPHMNCSSGVIGSPGIDHCNLNLSRPEGAEMDLPWLQTESGITAHSELLEAERDLIASYLKCITLAMVKIKSLAKDEAHIGQCWKRFAVSLSNLFSVEKDLEQAHIGDQIKSNKKNQPFRKLRKRVIDDGLRILARGKMARSNHGLKALETMINAYYADLNSIVTALREYSAAITQFHHFNEGSVRSNLRRENTNNNQNNEWSNYLKNLTWGVTRQVTGGETVVTTDLEPMEMEDLSTFYSLSTAQMKALQSRALWNEKMLKFSLTTFCRCSPLRNARMSWWYLKTEAKQGLNVHSAATALRQKLSIDPEAATAMKERRYDEDERRDNEAELNLVNRILDLGSSNAGNIFENNPCRQNATMIATEQVGRWNVQTAIALMGAAGVEDAEVQIDETSRELRHVRKYAISLRESVANCLESAEALAAYYILSSDNPKQIGRSRHEFWASVSAVFSGKLMEETGSDIPGMGSPSTRALAHAGIDITDRGGWLRHNDGVNQPNKRRRKCGEAARQYLKKRDLACSILISRVVKLLKDYERRLEGIESFVYMHCVGIQLEKHCSKARSKALSAWEKRTDISTAINVATKKKIPKLVQELKIKLDALPQVSHTTVLKRKEQHLASKTLKSDLHKLANRRFGRAQEVSTERVIAIMSLWAKHEESVALEEVKALGEAVQEVELSIQSADVDAALDSH